MKRQLTIWIFNQNDRLKKILLDRIHNTFDPSENYTDQYFGLIITFLKEPLEYYYDITFKQIGHDIFSQEENNVICIPCMHFNNVLFYLKKTPDHVIKFATEHNLKIILAYTRENFSPYEIRQMESFYEKNILSDDFKYKNIKILVNGFDELNQIKYPNLYININFFDKIMRNLIEKGVVAKSYLFLYERNYDFSFLIGQPRTERFVFLKRCFECGLIDDRFFYSLICVDKEDYKKVTLEQVKSFYKESDRSDIEDLFDSLIVHNAYDHNGMPHSDANEMFFKEIDFKIPIQLYNSYINIVFETRPIEPSLTEKIYKPIIAGIPFIWCGASGTLNYLKSKGYKEYPFINYDFDSAVDIKDKINLLIDEVLRLKKLNLKKLVSDCKDISKHNQMVFFETTNSSDEFLLKINE